ncbi:MAG TPA: M28 family metallopeptidase [Thermodesulfobacteriota bacterium]|nr:M28 family metallopeptidase [Thermodesulfobacteriota bacterium]
MEWLLQAYDRSSEKEIIESVSCEVPWKLVEYFSRLKRDSGTGGEREAARYITSQLESFGIPHQVYEPELYLSLPEWAKLRVLSPPAFEVRCKTPSFSYSTDGKPVEGNLIYVPTETGEKTEYLFAEGMRGLTQDVKGKIVLTEGVFAPQKAWEIESRGAIGQIYINPGSLIHEANFSTVWGTPTLENMHRIPRNPIVSINHPDGEKLIELCRTGEPRVSLQTKLAVRWANCPLPVAEIKGRVEPEKYILIHGHYDVWHYGVGDNATGNAACLEIARVFHQFKDRLSRGVKVAWWPGHSTGRYGGSTWFSDQFAIDLAENCIAQINIDSPGCRWATEYDGVMWMTEVNDFCTKVIKDITGKKARGIRPMRAGDYSFNHIGVTSMYMLMSTIPEDVRREKGFYTVGGCAGNSWVWHTENDTLDVADPDVLLTDTRIYVTSVLRMLNAHIFPFDFKRWAEDSLKLVENYQSTGKDLFDLNPVLKEMRALCQTLSQFYSEMEKTYQKGEKKRESFRKINQCLLELGRILIPIDYTRLGRYSHDPAIPIPSFPDLEAICQLPQLSPASNEFRFLKAQLLRGRNKVIDALRRARKELERCMEDL